MPRKTNHTWYLHYLWSTDRPLLWSLSASVIVHVLVLVVSLLILQTPPVPPVAISVQLTEAVPAGTGDTAAKTAPARRGVKSPGRPGQIDPKAAADQPTGAFSSGESIASSEAAAGRESGTPGFGEVATETGGIAIGGEVASGVLGGSQGKGSPAGKGAPSDLQGAVLGRKGNGGTSSSSSGSSQTPPTWPVIVVPEAIREATSPYEGDIYIQVDLYVLYGDYMSAGISVPGHEICREGDQLRTIHPVTFRQTKTDISMCYPLPYGEPERIHCPPEAHTVITTLSFLSSPINYSVNFCLTYDKSNCDWRDHGGDGPEREICKPGGEYKGLRATGTQFHYRCTKSDSQNHIHPLSYAVRFMRDVEFPEGRTRRRMVHSESRQIASCG